MKFVLRKEKNDDLLFSPLQSEFAKKILSEKQLEGNMDTMVLLQNDKIYTRSSAALRVTKYLRGFWPMIQVFLIVPAFIRNFIYNYIAKNRITWFGIADYCEMMTPEIKKRFIVP